MLTATRPENEKQARNLTVEEVAEELRISKPTVYQLLKSGQIKHLKIPGTGKRCIRRIPRSELDKFGFDHMEASPCQ
jgi:excisionase family DNA binding protein